MYGNRPQCGMFPTWRSSSEFVNLTLSKSLIPGWIFKPKASTILRLCHPTQTKGGAKCETLTWGGREFFVSFRRPARRLNWHLLGKGGFKERDDQLEDLTGTWGKGSVQKEVSLSQKFCPTQTQFLALYIITICYLSSIHLLSFFLQLLSITQGPCSWSGF